MIRGGDIGKMDVYLTIEEPTVTRDSETSEAVTTWSEFGNVWAEKIKNPRSEEMIEASQQVEKSKLTVWILITIRRWQARKTRFYSE